jgi:biotin operon repressor
VTISELLPDNEQDAVSYQILSVITGMSGRELRRAIRHERRQGQPILSSKRGLWLWNGEDLQEFEGTYKRLVRIGCDYLHTAKLMKEMRTQG